MTIHNAEVGQVVKACEWPGATGHECSLIGEMCTITGINTHEGLVRLDTMAWWPIEHVQSIAEVLKEQDELNQLQMDLIKGAHERIVELERIVRILAGSRLNSLDCSFNP